jgi:F-type H+-transporting ATPase subunit a
VAMGFLGFWAPFTFLIFFTAFEIFVALLQAYVFTILTCIYLHDSLHLH